MANEQNKINSATSTQIVINNPKSLKKQMTYSWGMKLENAVNNSADVSNKIHRCQEVEDLTEKLEHENEMLNQDLDALHCKTHLKRTAEFENLNEMNN